MTAEEARQMIVDGINYAAYKETDSSLHDSDKNRLFGSEHYTSGRAVVKPSRWAEGDFEEKMATLLSWANMLNRSDPALTEAQSLLEAEDSVIGRVIRRAKMTSGRKNDCILGVPCDRSADTNPDAPQREELRNNANEEIQDECVVQGGRAYDRTHRGIWLLCCERQTDELRPWMVVHDRRFRYQWQTRNHHDRTTAGDRPLRA